MSDGFAGTVADLRDELRRSKNEGEKYRNELVDLLAKAEFLQGMLASTQEESQKRSADTEAQLHDLKNRQAQDVQNMQVQFHMKVQNIAKELEHIKAEAEKESALLRRKLDSEKKRAETAEKMCDDLRARVKETEGR